MLFVSVVVVESAAVEVIVIWASVVLIVIDVVAELALVPSVAELSVETTVVPVVTLEVELTGNDVVEVLVLFTDVPGGVSKSVVLIVLVVVTVEALGSAVRL